MRGVRQTDNQVLGDHLHARGHVRVVLILARELAEVPWPWTEVTRIPGVLGEKRPVGRTGWAEQLLEFPTIGPRRRVLKLESSPDRARTIHLSTAARPARPGR